MPPIPITVLCGFLGSGKTTLLRRWRREESLRDAAFIVHDLSEFGLDAELVGGDDAAPEAGKLTGRVAALHGSHARGLLHESVGRALDGIAALEPPAADLLVESTGAARPWPLIRALTQDARYQLRHFIVTVDALNLLRDFDAGAALTTTEPADPALRLAASLLVEQIAFASLIVLAKTDLVEKDALNTMMRHLRRVNPHAAVGLSAQARLAWADVAGVPPPDLAQLEALAAGLSLDASPAATPGEVDCTIFREVRPFHPQRLYDVCQSQLSTGLYRTKGYLWLASRPGHVLVWQQSGSQISLELTGLWRAELVQNRDGKLLPEEIIALRERLATAHPDFGDRHIELTLIGLAAARDSFAAALQRALCTDSEVAEWKRGTEFPDPWPRQLRRV